MSASATLRWLLLGAAVWPALAFAPAPRHAALWSALFMEREADQSADVAATGVRREIVDWIVLSRNNDDMPFLVVDKVHAQLQVFDAKGTFLGATPILLGAARGDESVPGIGERPLAAVLPGEKTTPAGRFVGERGFNVKGEDIVWVDYDAAVSLHRVRPTNPVERRLERLATPTPVDNRISFGCINVPAQFYDTVVQRALVDDLTIVYVLPETRPAFSILRRPGPMTAAAS